MTEIFGIPIQAFMGQLTIGLVNGAFYAMLSLGLAAAAHAPLEATRFGVFRL